MKTLPKIAIVVVASAACISVVRPASAITSSRDQWDQAGSACQLVAPTTSSKVRQQAAGMRNEGTTSEYVICQYASTSGTFSLAVIDFTSIDGMDHTLKCTAMRGTTSHVPAYSTKSVSTKDNLYPEIFWVPADFGETDDFGNSLFSVTCLLPSGISLVNIGARYTEDVGS
jgi:hypothetical protein